LKLQNISSSILSEDYPSEPVNLHRHPPKLDFSDYFILFLPTAYLQLILFLKFVMKYKDLMAFPPPHQKKSLKNQDI